MLGSICDSISAVCIQNAECPISFACIRFSAGDKTLKYMLFCSAIKYIVSEHETRLLLFLFGLYLRIFVNLVKTYVFNVDRFNRKLIQNG